MPPRSYHSIAIYNVSRLCPREALPASKLPKYRYLQCCPPAHEVLPPQRLPKYCYLHCSPLVHVKYCRPRSYQSIATYSVPPPALMRYCRPQYYQSIATRNVPPLSRIAALEVTKAWPFTIFPSRPHANARYCRPRNYQSIAVYSVPPLPP